MESLEPEASWVGVMVLSGSCWNVWQSIRTKISRHRRRIVGIIHTSVIKQPLEEFDRGPMVGLHKTRWSWCGLTDPTQVIKCVIFWATLNQVGLLCNVPNITVAPIRQWIQNTFNQVKRQKNDYKPQHRHTNVQT